MCNYIIDRWNISTHFIQMLRMLCYYIIHKTVFSCSCSENKNEELGFRRLLKMEVIFECAVCVDEGGGGRGGGHMFYLCIY